MQENDPLAGLRMFPGSAAEQVIALTDLWRQRSKRTFVAMRERMNEIGEPDVALEPAAFDNYFRRANRQKTPEAVVWALILVMRDEAWLPRAQQCMLAEALYLAALKNASIVTYARIYRLFPGQEEEFKRLCPLGDVIVERAAVSAEAVKEGAAGEELSGAPNSDQPAIGVESAAAPPGLAQRPGLHWALKAGLIVLLVIFAALIVWTLISSLGWAV